MTDTSPPVRVPGLRGRRPAVFPPELQVLAAYLVTPLPAPTLPLDVSGGLTAFGMDGNGPDPTLTVNNGQPVGDCGFAGMAHKMLADAAVGKETFTAPDSNQVVTEYLAYDGGQDQGVVVSDMMRAWFSSGFFGQKIDGYVPIGLNQIDAAMAVFGAVILGVNLTDDADQLFTEGQPWTVSNGEQPDPNEGHVVVKVKSDAEFDTVVTWGALQQATKEWSAACVEEAWAPVTAEMARNATLNLSALLNDIRSIGGGQAIPDPIPVTPPPPVQPPAPPAPTPPEPVPAPTPPTPTPPTPTPPVPVPPPVPPRPGPVPGVIAEVEHDAEVAEKDVEKLAEDAIHDIEDG